jgi:ABC-type phosphate transport system auxiliary subunit
MLSHIVSDIHEHYVTEILKPQLGKTGAAKPTSSSDLDGDGNVDSFEKKVRQFVYDVRHLVRKNNIPVEKAFQMRSAKTNHGAAVVKTAKEKLGIKSGGTAPVSEEVDGEKLYSVVIRYKNGTTYRKRTSRSEINRLRSNPNVSSVEMTKYGVDGLAKKDYDGDGKVESPSKEHAGAVHNAIQRKKGGVPDGQDTRGKTSKKKLKSHGLGEGFSNWRGDLCEIDGEIENKKQTQIKEKKVKNKIVINPPLNLETHIQNLGGELINITENIISDYNEIDIFSELNEHEISFLNDNLIDKILEEVFYEFIEEGYDIDEIVDILTENIDINVDILNEAKVTYGHDTENETKTDRLGKVKSGIKRIGKALARGAGYVSGAAVRGAKSAAKEFGSAYEKGRKRSSDTESSDSESRTRTSRSTPGLLSRIGTKLKSGLKKVVGKTARSVSRGARNIARSVGEEVEISEKITADTDMGTAIRDFYGSDSPQLAGRTKEERREAAIAAVLTARRGGKKIGEAIVDQPTPADDKVREKQNAAIKKQQMQNMKAIQRKREQLERQKLKLQQQDKLPMHSDSYELEGKLVDEAIAGLRPASERTKNTITPAQRKKQEQERKRKEELAHKARLVIAGITKTAKTGEVTQSKPKSDAPESNRKLKPGQKKDTLAVKADKIISSSYEPEGEVVDELTRFEKEKGKDFRTGKPSTPGGTWKNDPVMRHMNKVMGSARMGVQPRGKKKEPGKKPPAAGEVGSGVSSPAQKVQGRRAAAERAREFVQNTRGT